MPLDDKSLITLLRMQFATPVGFTLTDHARQQRAKRDISIHDICNCVFSGQIIERQDFGRDPIVLIRGQKLDKTEMHLAVALAKDTQVVVTVYNPGEDEWEVYKGKIRRKQSHETLPLRRHCHEMPRLRRTDDQQKGGRG